MKVEVKEKESFKHITIEVVIESEEELCDLWHRMNIQTEVFESEDYENKCDLKYLVKRNITLWGKLNELINQNNLRNE